MKILKRKIKKVQKEPEGPKEYKGRSDQDKLDSATSRLVKLNMKLGNILERLIPLENERDKLQGDLRYYESRVEKLTARLHKKEVKNG